MSVKVAEHAVEGVGAGLPQHFLSVCGQTLEGFFFFFFFGGGGGGGGESGTCHFAFKI